VTKFTLKTYPIKKFWTGVRIFNCTRAEYHAGLQQFVENQNEFPKVATLMPFGTQVLATPHKATTKSLFAYPGGLNSSSEGLVEAFQTDSMAQVEYVMKALKGYSYLNQNLIPAEVHDILQSQGHLEADVPGYRVMLMIYDGETVPKGAWGKKFEAMPAIGTFGGAVEYSSIVRPPPSELQNKTLILRWLDWCL
jgi:hypothetical protein